MEGMKFGVVRYDIYFIIPGVQLRQISTFWRAMRARLRRRMSSSVLPENILPQITSICPGGIGIPEVLEKHGKRPNKPTDFTETAKMNAPGRHDTRGFVRYSAIPRPFRSGRYVTLREVPKIMDQITLHRLIQEHLERMRDLHRSIAFIPAASLIGDRPVSCRIARDLRIGADPLPPQRHPEHG